MKASVKFGKRFQMGAYSAFTAAILIVIANMAAGALPTSLTQLDLTDNEMYTLSEQTKRIVSGIDRDVNLYLLATSGSEDETITRLLKRYQDLSDKVHVEYVDPTLKPTFLDSYDLSQKQLYANSVIVDCGGKYRLVGYNDIYVTTYNSDSSSYYGYTTSTSFSGENALTNAIHYVASDNLPKAYILTGHGETEFSETILDMFDQDNLETESLSLLSLEAVPEDADIVVIHEPQTDLGDEETETLRTWMNNGGRLLLVTGYVEDGKMTNLLSIAADMGLKLEKGLVFEGDNNMHLSRYPHYLLPDPASHEITDALISEGYYIMTPFAQAISETEDSSADVTFLLTTSDSAYIKPAGMESTTSEHEDGDIDGACHVAALSEKGNAKMVWFASETFLDDTINRAVSGGNDEMFMNAAEYMCDMPESISIRGKVLEESSLTVTDSQNRFWSVVMIGIIPLTLAAIGTCIAIRRKKK